MSIINLPVTVCYGLSAVAVPILSAKNKEKNQTALIIISTLVLAVLGAIATYIFSPLAVKILFPKLGEDYKILTYTLIRAGVPIIVFSALLQTLNAVLIAKNRTYKAIVGCLIGCTVKIILQSILLKNQSLNIFGSVISLISCYLLACFFNLLYIKKYADKENSNGKIHHRK
jgi:O-antigen/teichoic acid export membrane protein